MAASQASSRLEMLQARFQQKQLQEKEQKLLQLYDQQQQRAYQVVQRGSAGSNASSNQGSVRTTAAMTTTTTTTSTSQGGKVRQMFDERRQTTVKGIDRSYPLEPLENKLRKTNGVAATQRNSNLAVNRQSVSMKRMARANVNSNINGGKPVVSYHEEITRESFGPFAYRHDDEDEFGIENRVATFANGHYRHDADNELENETLDQEAIERNRMMAKIHLMGFDETLKHRVRNDLEGEEFPEYLMVDVPDKLPKKSVTKKLSQAEARLERFKNTIAKKNSVLKQPTSSSTVLKKRSEQMELARSSPQGDEIAGTHRRSGSWTSERNERILANMKNPLPAKARAIDGMNRRREESSDGGTFSQKDGSGISSWKITKARTCPRNDEFKSLTSDGKIFTRRSPSPRFFRTESELRSGIDRKSTDSRLAWSNRTKRATNPQLFRRANERSTMSIDREIDGSLEWNSEVTGKRSISPRYSDIVSRRNAKTTSIVGKVSGARSPEWNMRSSPRASASPPFFLRESNRSDTAVSINGSASRLESPDWGERIFARSKATPEYSPKQRERSETSTSMNRGANLSESPLFYQETKRANPRFFLNKFERSRRKDKSNSPIWNKEISLRNTNPRKNFRDEFKQARKSINADRESFESGSLKRDKVTLAKQNARYLDKKHRESTTPDREAILTESPSYEEDILKRHGASPQFFCRESERSATTMSIDRASSGSRSPSERKIITKRSSSPQFFCRESERSATTMSIDRRVNESGSSARDRKISMKQSKSPQYRKHGQRYTAITDKSGSTGTAAGPQFFCKENEKSATTMLIEPSRSSRTDSAKGISERRNYPDIAHEQSRRSSPSINKRASSTQSGYMSKSLISKDEMKGNLKEHELSVAETRRSSRASVSSATSASSIVNLKYGLEFDNIFQSAELVRKFMKSQKGEQRAVRQSSPKRDMKNVNAPRDTQSRDRYKSLPLSQKTRSPAKAETEERKRTTPESPRKSITPTEVDMEIQEITMTDHRIERDRLRNIVSPRSERLINGTFTRSSDKKAKFKSSVTYPVRKTHRQRASILGSDIFREENSKSKGTKDRRSDRDSEGSVVSLSKIDKSSPMSKTSRYVAARAEDREVDAEVFKRQEQTWNQSMKNRTELIEAQPEGCEDRQRASSLSPNQARCRFMKDDGSQSSKVRSSDSFRGKQRPAVSPILCKRSSKLNKAIQSAGFDQSRKSQYARLAQGALKGKGTIDERNQRELEDKRENRAADGIDAGIDAKYRTIVETALSKKTKSRRKIASQNSARDIRNKDAFVRKGTRASAKSITPKRAISLARECGRQHDVKSNASSRALSSKQARKKISRETDIAKISLSQRAMSKANRSSSPGFLMYAVKSFKEDDVVDARKTAGSCDKIIEKHGNAKSDDIVKEISRVSVRREDKSENNFGRMDSVESALRRFDSIGAEFEHSGPESFPKISLRMMNVQTEISAKGPVASQGSTRVDSREVTEDAVLKSPLECTIDKDPKVKSVARRSDLKILEKEIYSSEGPRAKTKSFAGSKQRSAQTRSPACKRQLFRSNVGKENQLRSSHAKARKKEDYPSVKNIASRKSEAFSKVGSADDLDREVAKGSTRLEETPGFSVKPLRSIEDIRRSIDNERDKLAAAKESRSAIANRRLASREGIDARKSVSATDAARNIFSEGDPTRLTKLKSCVSRTTKSPSPDVAARKQHETNAARTTRGNVLSSPSKSFDLASRRVTTDPKNQETKFSKRSTIAKGADSIGNKAAATAAVDVADGVVLQNGSPYESPTKKSEAFVIDLDDQPSKENDASVISKKPATRKASSDQQPTIRGSSRPISSSSSSANSSQSPASSTKVKMTTKSMSASSSGTQIKKTFSAKSSANNMDNLVPCNICKRNFAQDRISYHENVCAKTMNKKRKQFNTKVFRIRGTDHESFVKKHESFDKKQEPKVKKPEVKTDWRRKHEEFINTIRYAKQVQAHMAAGGNPNDISPPPPSDTSDYIQCPHCGRKFNQAAAERHIPKCENMRHNKPALSRAPRPRR